ISGTYNITYQLCEVGATPPNCDTATATVTVEPKADLVINKVVDNATPKVGDNVTFTIKVKNNGPNDATNVNVNEALPTGYTLVSATSATGTYTAPTWSIGNLANAAEATLTVVAKVKATGDYLNKVTVTGTEEDPIPGNDKDEKGTTPVAQSDLVITKVVDVANPKVGDTVKFTIKVKNNGPSDATNVKVTENIPTGYAYVSGATATGAWANPTWTIGNLANGSEVSLDVFAKVNASGNYENRVTVVGDQNDPTAADKEAKATVIVVVPSITAKDDTIPSGNGTTGTPNAGNVLVGNPTNPDTLNGTPVVIGLVNLTVAIPAVPKTPGALVPLIDMATGTVSVPANTPGGTYTLTYSICEKTNPSNCSSATVTIFVATPSIALVKTAHFNDENGDGYAKVGETITYNFAVTNTGNVALTNVFIVDPLTGVTMTGGPINLAVGQEDTTSFTGIYSIVQADINLGSISNQAEVYGTSPDNSVVKDKSDNSSVVDDSPTVLPISGCVIKVFNAISPNGDKENERFYIQGLECYPDNTVEIYNRWGVLVFEREHYNNDDVVFKGFSEGRVTVKDADGLPEGTYYYVLKYKDGESNAHQQAGYLYLSK
ncbi:DUF11 domain-containing protein, partial [Flavobacterium sp. ZT3R18]|uniref:DUF7507 domain-containing protein n=1 Tax=Flavobacterium sp. ZT3R18 TaxID=2594429 RepID=UPI00117A94B8